MNPRLNERQVEVLRWISEGCPERAWESDTYKHSAVALRNRKLATVKGHGLRWTAAITEAGSFYLEHGKYPEGHYLAPKPPAPPANAVPPSVQTAAEKLSEGLTKGSRRALEREREAARQQEKFVIDSPRRLRARAKPARGEERADESKAHPWDDRVLVTAKEAAWVLSLSEGMIRQAVRDGDVDRVFIGEGTTHYRIVYASLLAWVNTMPTESPRYHYL
ncbi:MAG: excisionase [Propionibacteriales bacterium]|nr:excisionase [Propionibacteriales bacterium]